MALIGSLVVGMTLDTTTLAKGLDSAASKMAKFSKGGAAELAKGLATLATSGKGLDQIGTGLGKIATAPLAAGLKSIAGAVRDLLSMLKTAAAGFAALSVASTVALGGFAYNAAAAIDSTGDMADRLGTTTAALSEMRYATKLTGSDAEALDSALTKMSANLGDAALRGGPAAMALQRLGLDAKKLAIIDPAEAFKRISGGFERIPSAAEKASLAMDVFGKGGASLLNTLSVGPKELEKFAAEFRKFGGSVTESQRQSVGAMFDAFDRIGAIIAGVGTQLAVQLAPYVTAVADEFVSMATNGQSMGSVVTSAIESVVRTIALAADQVQNLSNAFRNAGTNITGTVKEWVGGISHLESRATAGGIVSTFSDIKAGLVDLSKASWSDQVAAGFARIKSRAEEAGNAAAKSRIPIKDIGNDYITTNTKIDELTRGIQAQIAAFGKSAHEIELQKLAQAGASAEALAGVRALDMQLMKMEEFKKSQDKLRDDAKTLAESVRTPFEAFGEELAKLQKMKDAGFINAEQFSRGVDKAKGATEGTSSNTPRLAGAFEAGSKEAYSAIAQSQAGTRGDSTPKEHLAVAKTALKYQEEINAYQAEIASGFRTLVGRGFNAAGNILF